MKNHLILEMHRYKIKIKDFKEHSNFLYNKTSFKRQEIVNQKKNRQSLIKKR